MGSCKGFCEQAVTNNEKIIDNKIAKALQRIVTG
jgi:hypothetical protein